MKSTVLLTCVLQVWQLRLTNREKLRERKSLFLLAVEGPQGAQSFHFRWQIKKRRSNIGIVRTQKLSSIHGSGGIVDLTGHIKPLGRFTLPTADYTVRGDSTRVVVHV